ncbi:MAG: GFA family protein [Hyphomicrobiales bacterium]|nr:MAG: GFA family protein [Hyphomicrobiales bacterium]
MAMDRKPRPIVDLTASCACGAVSVRLAGKVLSMFMCACEDCQKASGTGHSTIVLARPDDVTITGETRSFARPANSGATLTRSFCPQCGTPIAARSSRAEQLLMLPAGLFGSATEWYAPNQLIFARSHREWDEIAADLPRHDTYRDPGALM